MRPRGKHLGGVFHESAAGNSVVESRARTTGRVGYYTAALFWKDNQMLRSILAVAILIVVAGARPGWQSSLLAQEDGAETTPSPAKQADRAPGDSPQAFIAKTTHEVGDIPRGKTVSYEFLIENHGQGPLELNTIAKCGCTVVDHDKVIPPGGQGKIKAELRTRKLRGAFQKSIEVQTNDPAQQRFQLVLAGRIVETVELVPRQVPMMTLKFDGPTELKIGLRTMEHVAVTGVTSQVTYAPARIEPNGDRAYELHITVGADAPLGRSDFVLMLATTAQDEHTIPITVSCDKGIVVTPPTFGFRSRRAGPVDSFTSMVLLKKREGKIHVRTAASSDPNLKVDVAPIKDGLIYRLTATYRGELSNLNGTGVVTVETDDPHQPKLEIPVRNSLRANELKVEAR